MILLAPTILLLRLVAALKDGEMELLLVQALWRHGDRSPTKTFKNDPYQEGNWTFGGGGFGQLSPLGMKQHMNLGKLLRKTYIDTGFLGRRYSSKEIYVRSTDANRTIISAMSNMVGMYGQPDGGSVVEEDYPYDPSWPAGYVPIAVHTVHKPTDYVGIPDGDCKRREELWELALSSPELQEYKNRPDVSKMMMFLNSKCGQTINLDNLHVVRDPLYVEQIYFNDTLRKVNPWFSDDLFRELNEMYNQMEHYKNGGFNKKMINNGLDIGFELRKVRGGAMFNELTDHMNSKLECLKSDEAKCKWIKPLKYFAYSVHDSTVFTFLSLMGIERKVIVPGVFPEYSAATFVELWMNQTDHQPYFKLTYHKDDKSGIDPITKEIEGCGGKTYCKLDVFRSIAAKFKPDRPMAKWCKVSPGKENEKEDDDGKKAAASWSLSILVFAVVSIMLSHL